MAFLLRQHSSFSRRGSGLGVARWCRSSWSVESSESLCERGGDAALTTAAGDWMTDVSRGDDDDDDDDKSCDNDDVECRSGGGGGGGGGGAPDNGAFHGGGGGGDNCALD